MCLRARALNLPQNELPFLVPKKYIFFGWGQGPNSSLVTGSDQLGGSESSSSAPSPSSAESFGVWGGFQTVPAETWA